MELEKSASHTKSIVEAFSAQHEKNEGHHSALPSDPSSLPVLSQSSSAKMIKKVKTKFELQTRTAHDLGKLLRLKTQIDKYGYELSHKSSYYRRHQMVRCFLWMQLNKKKDNLQLAKVLIHLKFSR